MATRKTWNIYFRVSDTIPRTLEKTFQKLNYKINTFVRILFCRYGAKLIINKEMDGGDQLIVREMWHLNFPMFISNVAEFFDMCV